jgi:SAM-dependent methyltransferase
MKQVCKICENADRNRLHIVREMAFGLREQFTYLECGRCGCVQLLNIPQNMAKYYPPGYYSLQAHGALKTLVRRRWSRHAYGKKNLVGWFVSYAFFPHRPMLAFRRVNPPKTAQILDVGCGRGYLLQDLAALGFRNLTGADPFVERDLAYESGVKVFKRSLAEMNGQFDLIMLHHSFEHMDEPATVMQNVAAKLAPNGQVILGIPVASSYAWKHYGVNWVNLDAPRHFYLHTLSSIELLAGQVGLEIQNIVHEGNDEQFWGSEQFARDIPSNDARSIGSSALRRFSHWNTILACRAKANELNAKQQGDLVCFHLQKAE